MITSWDADRVILWGLVWDWGTPSCTSVLTPSSAGNANVQPDDELWQWNLKCARFLELNRGKSLHNRPRDIYYCYNCYYYYYWTRRQQWVLFACPCPVPASPTKENNNNNLSMALFHLVSLFAGIIEVVIVCLSKRGVNGLVNISIDFMGCLFFCLWHCPWSSCGHGVRYAIESASYRAQCNLLCTCGQG